MRTPGRDGRGDQLHAEHVGKGHDQQQHKIMGPEFFADRSALIDVVVFHKFLQCYDYFTSVFLNCLLPAPGRTQHLFALSA